MVLMLAAMPPVALASNSVGTGAAHAALGEAATAEMLLPGGTPEPMPAETQMMDDDHGGWRNNGWWIIMPIMMVIFWGGVFGLIVWGIRQFTRDRDRDRVRSPLDIAKERLARGEISKEEFDRIRVDLA
jgi:putative membrane protein